MNILSRNLMGMPGEILYPPSGRLASDIAATRRQIETRALLADLLALDERARRIADTEPTPPDGGCSVEGARIGLESAIAEVRGALAASVEDIGPAIERAARAQAAE